MQEHEWKALSKSSNQIRELFGGNSFFVWKNVTISSLSATSEPFICAGVVPWFIRAFLIVSY